MSPAHETLQKAAALHRSGRLEEADHWYRAILDSAPDLFDALHQAGIVSAQRGRFDEALGRLQRAIEVNPTSADAQSDYGSVLHVVGRREEALAHWDRALAIKPEFAGAWSNRSVALRELGRLDDALASCARALALAPDSAGALTNCAAVQNSLARHDEALASCDRALALAPSAPEAMHNRAVALCGLARFNEALEACDSALALAPNDAIIHNTRGLALHGLERHDDAIRAFDRALALDERLVMALQNRGIELSLHKQFEEAARDLARALQRDPELAFASGQLLWARISCCDWRDLSTLTARMLAGVRGGARTADPFVLVAVGDSASDQLRCARTWVASKHPPSPTPLWSGERYGHERIRVAYLSADLQEHATAYLMAELFERHDRARFEVTAMSWGAAGEGPMRGRLTSAFERFIDVQGWSDREVAQRLRELEIDIAVDLKGFTHDSRPGILSRRPSPVQVSYLGYPGTLGAPYIDYVVADGVVIPEGEERHYAEQVVRLPDSYQVNDRQRRIAGQTPTRGEAGLPEGGVVFCSFNNNYKITPEVFGVWMGLLRQVEGSVLWLLEGNAVAPGNLRREAQARGIAPERLVFAPRTGLAEHLARHRLADLFLDTLPYNAHTTASDALWAGLPVVTCQGRTFAGRVAGSLLTAVGLPELITRDLGEYEALALRLAREPEALSAVKAKLARNRDSCPLFDVERFRRHLEAAYETMWGRAQRGEAPAGFAVAPLAS